MKIKVFLASCILSSILLIMLPAAFSDEAKTQLNALDKWTAVKGTEVHTIRLIDVTTRGDACGLEIDGKMVWVDVGDDIRVNGLYVKVFGAFPVHSQTKDNDACEVFIGGTLTRYVEPEAGEAEEEKDAEEPEENITAEPEPEAPEPQLTEVSEPKEEKESFWQKIAGFFRNFFGLSKKHS